MTSYCNEPEPCDACDYGIEYVVAFDGRRLCRNCLFIEGEKLSPLAEGILKVIEIAPAAVVRELTPEPRKVVNIPQGEQLDLL